ncbi:MAG TPA: hypothetical protein VMF06_11460 [Candidatus Limnocylindria bacterium]|nr:hypothetical protein [Candidatus Limnocylindria bacterium]
MKRVLILGAVSAILAQKASATWVSMTDSSFCQTWDFNQLASSGTGTWINDDTAKGLQGWFADYSSQNASTGSQAIIASDGSSTSKSLFSFGNSSDRALGSVAPVSTAPGNQVYGILLRNTTGATLNNIYVSYRGEQWRNGGSNVGQSLGVSYAISSDTGSFFVNNSSQHYPGMLSPDVATGTGTQRASTSDTYANWVGVSDGTFNAPTVSSTAGALNGNAAVNSTLISFTLSNLGLANGDFIFLRWRDTDNSGTDSGLAIDDVDICLTAVPETDTVAAILAVAAIGGGTAWRRLRRKA